MTVFFKWKINLWVIGYSGKCIILWFVFPLNSTLFGKWSQEAGIKWTNKKICLQGCSCQNRIGRLYRFNSSVIMAGHCLTPKLSDCLEKKKSYFLGIDTIDLLFLFLLVLLTRTSKNSINILPKKKKKKNYFDFCFSY